MFAAKSGHSKIGIPASVGAEFAASDPGGKLPAKARDMARTKWSALKRLLLEWIDEERAEPEHAGDEVKHDPANGQFIGSGGGVGTPSSSDNPKVQLSDGVSLHDNSNPNFPDEPEFFFHDKDGKKIGSLSLYTYPEYGKTINSIHITDEGFRGKGLGTQAIKAMAEKYGSISSDPQANTSLDAVKMWQRLGAEKVSTTKNTKGYLYQLKKSGAKDEKPAVRAAGIAFVTPTGDCLFLRRAARMSLRIGLEGRKFMTLRMSISCPDRVLVLLCKTVRFCYLTSRSKPALLIALLLTHLR